MEPTPPSPSIWAFPLLPPPPDRPTVAEVPWKPRKRFRLHTTLQMDIEHENTKGNSDVHGTSTIHFSLCRQGCVQSYCARPSGYNGSAFTRAKIGLQQICRAPGIGFLECTKPFPTPHTSWEMTGGRMDVYMPQLRIRIKANFDYIRVQERECSENWATRRFT